MYSDWVSPVALLLWPVGLSWPVPPPSHVACGTVLGALVWTAGQWRLAETAENRPENAPPRHVALVGLILRDPKRAKSRLRLGGQGHPLGSPKA